jgi:copper chaperone
LPRKPINHNGPFAQASTKPNDPVTQENIMSTQTFPVTGLTCGHCVGAITSELSVLAGVENVEIDLVVDGTSTLRVTTGKELTDDEVAAALDEAGEYKLASI